MNRKTSLSGAQGVGPKKDGTNLLGRCLVEQAWGEFLPAEAFTCIRRAGQSKGVDSQRA